MRTWQILTLWLLCVAPLSCWGLPTSAYDEFLFADEPKWPAERYRARRALDERSTRTVGADVDLDPLVRREVLIELSADKGQRAQILRRYRLYSRQPDEMITFMALQRMNPRAFDFDPHLYQYGGAYIYLVGAAIGLASLVGYVQLTSDVGVYLAEPELFARFYVVARLISLVFGAFALAAVVRLARRGGGRTAGWIAFALVAASPVFLSGVLDAKPHIPSACMLLWATHAALVYHEHSRLRDVVRLGIFSGLAFGLMLTGAAAALLWAPLAILMRRGGAKVARDLLLAAGLALGVYALTNPYVVYNLFGNQAALTGNLENSTAMYSLTRIPAGALRVVTLLYESAALTPFVGALACVLLLLRLWGPQTVIGGTCGVGLLLLCIALGAGKPAEFARFLVVPVMLLSVAAAIFIARVAVRRLVLGVVLTVALLFSMRTPAYVWSFVCDSASENESRMAAARYLKTHLADADAVAVVQEPAPYAIPPLDFVRRRVVLLPLDEPKGQIAKALPRWLVLTADDEGAIESAWWRRHYELDRTFPDEMSLLSRITWANKPVFIFRRILDAP